MPRSGDLAAAAMFFTGLSRAIVPMHYRCLEQVGQVVEKAAKEAIGNPDNGYGWAPLKDETIARKASGNTPLLETGTLQASYSHVVEGETVHIGTNDQVGVWQELGTSRIPPRPVLVPSVLHNEEKIKAILKRNFEAVFTGTQGPELP